MSLTSMHFNINVQKNTSDFENSESLKKKYFLHFFCNKIFLFISLQLKDIFR